MYFCTLLEWEGLTWQYNCIHLWFSVFPSTVTPFISVIGGTFFLTSHYEVLIILFGEDYFWIYCRIFQFVKPALISPFHPHPLKLYGFTFRVHCLGFFWRTEISLVEFCSIIPLSSQCCLLRLVLAFEEVHKTIFFSPPSPKHWPMVCCVTSQIKASWEFSGL